MGALRLYQTLTAELRYVAIKEKGKKDNDLNSNGCAVKPGLSYLDQCYCILMRIVQGCGWDCG